MDCDAYSVEASHKIADAQQIKLFCMTHLMGGDSLLLLPQLAYMHPPFCADALLVMLTAHKTHRPL